MRTPFRHFTDFSFRRWVEIEAEHEPDGVHRLFALFGDDGVNDWFAARQDRGELTGYLADLEIARQLADEAAARGSALAIGLQIRYALIGSTVRELAARIPPAIVGRMMEAGKMTAEQALCWGRQSLDEGNGYEIRVATLGAAGPAALAEEWLDTIELGGAVRDADNRVLGLVRAAAAVPAHFHKRMLAVVEQEPNEGSRGGALRTLMEVPGLGETTRREAWRIACAISHQRIRAETMMRVAPALGAAEQEEALEAFQEELERQAAEPERIGADLELDRAIELIAGMPAERLDAWHGRLAGAGFGVLIRASLILQEAASAPLALFAKVRSNPPTLPTAAWARLCSELADADRGADALFCLEQMRYQLGSEWEETLAHLLARGAPGARDEAAAIFARQAEYIQERIFDLARATPGSDVAMLRRLAELGPSERDRARLASRIGGAVDETVRDALFEANLTELPVVGRLAPHLSRGQVERALAANTESVLYAEERTALFERLLELGGPDCVLARIREHVAAYERGTVAGKLAAQWPEARIADLFATLRPDEVGREAAQFRWRLAAKLPLAQALALVREAESIAKAVRRLETLSAFLERQPPPEALGALVEAVLRAIEASLATQANPLRDDAVEGGLRALAALPGERLPAATVQRVVAAIDAAGPGYEPKLRWLTILCDADGGGTGCALAWQGAAGLAVAAGDAEALDALGRRARPDHRPILQAMADRLPAEPLTVFAAAAAQAMDEATADAFCRRLARARKWSRYGAYMKVLPRASPPVKRAVIARERRRLLRSRRGAKALFWDNLFNAAVPGTVAEADILRRQAALAPAARLDVALEATRLPDPPAALFGPALPALAGLPEEMVSECAAVLAPNLDQSQIRELLALQEWDDPWAKEALAALAGSALRHGDTWLAIEAAGHHADRFESAEVLEALIDELPAELLDWWYSAAQAQPRRFEAGNDPEIPLGAIPALAHRAAVIGRIDLLKGFLELRSSWSGGDRPVETIFGAVPESQLDAAFEVAKELRSIDRTEAIAAVLHRQPERATSELIAELLTESFGSHESRQRTISRLLAPALRQLSREEVGALFAAMMRAVGAGSRRTVLGIAGIFAEALLAAFGDEVAAALDEACAIGCRPDWP